MRILRSGEERDPRNHGAHARGAETLSFKNQGRSCDDGAGAAETISELHACFERWQWRIFLHDRQQEHALTAGLRMLGEHLITTAHRGHRRAAPPNRQDETLPRREHTVAAACVDVNVHKPTDGTGPGGGLPAGSFEIAATERRGCAGLLEERDPQGFPGSCRRAILLGGRHRESRPASCFHGPSWADNHPQ